MSRWRAGLIHLSICVVVAGLLLGSVYFLLYPPPLFRAMGGFELTLLVTSIDVILGPLLTICVFRSGKRGLGFDLGVIATLQVIALSYGLSIVWVARPVFIAVRDDVAYVVSANDIAPESLAKGASPEYQTLSWAGPVVVRLKRPDSGAEQQRILDLNLSTGQDIQQLPEFYRPWAVPATDILEKAESLGDLLHRKPQHAAAINLWLQTNHREVGSVRYLALLAMHEDLCLAVDADTGAYLGIIDADPS